METIGACLPNTVSVTVPPIVSSFLRLRIAATPNPLQTDEDVFVRSMSSGNAQNATLDKARTSVVCRSLQLTDLNLCSTKLLVPQGCELQNIFSMLLGLSTPTQTIPSIFQR
jgi:hypothetical protein